MSASTRFFEALFIAATVSLTSCATRYQALRAPPPTARPPAATRASEDRYLTLTDVNSGEVCHGGFNLAHMEGWAFLPDGTGLRGHLLGNSDATERGPGTQSQGSAILASTDGTQQMTVHVVSDGLVMHGTGEGIMNDGRRFRIQW